MGKGLSLKRHVGERILIGDDIELVVVSISGAYVKLGLEAPSNKRIRRGETADESPHVGRDKGDKEV